MFLIIFHLYVSSGAKIRLANSCVLTSQIRCLLLLRNSYFRFPSKTSSRISFFEIKSFCLNQLPLHFRDDFFGKNNSLRKQIKLKSRALCAQLAVGVRRAARRGSARGAAGLHGGGEGSGAAQCGGGWQDSQGAAAERCAARQGGAAVSASVWGSADERLQLQSAPMALCCGPCA